MQCPVRPQMGAWPPFRVYFPSLPSWFGQSSHLAPRFLSIIPAPCCPQSLFISCAPAEECSSLRSHVLCPLTSSRSLLQHHLLSETFPKPQSTTPSPFPPPPASLSFIFLYNSHHSFMYYIFYSFILYLLTFPPPTLDS